MSPLVLAFPQNESLATALCRALEAAPVGLEMRSFPDSETYVRIAGDVGDRSVVIVCTLKNPDALLLPLIFVCDTLRELGAQQVGLVAPYLAYMRQDRRFRDGEAVTSTSFARLISAHVDWLVTMDPHLHRWHTLDEIYSIPTSVVHAAPLLADWVRTHISNPLIIGPDSESEQWVREVAGAVPCPYLVLEKVRRGDRDVVVSRVPEIRRWAGSTPVLVDDIISSATTMSETVRQWVAAGLPAPVCLGVHAVFAEGAVDALHRAGAGRIVTTSSIPHVSNAIDVSPALIAPVREHLSRAVSSSTRTR